MAELIIFFIIGIALGYVFGFGAAMEERGGGNG